MIKIRKIHIGCGKRDFGPGWYNIDGTNHPHVHYNDITKLPFKDESIELIYASHVFEYFDREEAVGLIQEWKRVLKKDGVLRLAVPDLEAMAKLYAKGQFPLENFLGPLFGKMEMEKGGQIVNIYHKKVCDYDSMKRFLKANGLNKIRKYDWRQTEHSIFDDQSRSYLPHMDKKDGTLISLNVECKK